MIINQKFIAQEAGVSQKTVSIYFQERSRIAPKTRERIDAVVRRHNYFPNAAARSIKSNRFNRIACVVVQYGRRDTVTHPHLMAYINGASMELAQHGYSLVMEPVFVNAKTFEVDFPEFFSMRAADGIIGIPGSWIPPEIDARIATLELPAIWLNRQTDDPELNSIFFDETKGAEELGRHLLKHGKHNIAWFGPEYTEDKVIHYSSRIRCETLKRTLEAGGGRQESFFSKITDTLQERVQAVISRLAEFDAVVCYNFYYREAVVWEAVRTGVDLRRISLTHFASAWEFNPRNFDFSDLVLMPEAELGRRGAEFILKTLNGEDARPLLEPIAGKLHIAGDTSAEENT